MESANRVFATCDASASTFVMAPNGSTMVTTWSMSMTSRRSSFSSPSFATRSWMSIASAAAVATVVVARSTPTATACPPGTTMSSAPPAIATPCRTFVPCLRQLFVSIVFSQTESEASRCAARCTVPFE